MYSNISVKSKLKTAFDKKKQDKQQKEGKVNVVRNEDGFLEIEKPKKVRKINTEKEFLKKQKR